MSVVLYKPWRRWMAQCHGWSVLTDEKWNRNEPRESEDEAGVVIHESGSSAQRGQTEVVGKWTTSQVVVKATHETRIEDEIV